MCVYALMTLKCFYFPNTNTCCCLYFPISLIAVCCDARLTSLNDTKCQMTNVINYSSEQIHLISQDKGEKISVQKSIKTQER